MSEQGAPAGTLLFRDVTIQLFDDGEFVRVVDGGADCSEHGDLIYDDVAREQCNHNPPGDGPVFEPAFDIERFVGAAASDERVQDAVLEHLDITAPEKLTEAARPLLADEEEDR